MKKYLFIFLFFWANAASAIAVSFDIIYSGEIFGNTALGLGRITINEEAFINAKFDFGSFSTAEQIGITDFSLTITGASAGNGTFGLQEVEFFILVTSGPIDLSTELIGQPGLDDFNIGECMSSGSPRGVTTFTITTNCHEAGDILKLTSVSPVPNVSPVPEPPAMWLFGAGLLGLFGIKRRKLLSHA